MAAGREPVGERAHEAGVAGLLGGDVEPEPQIGAERRVDGVEGGQGFLEDEARHFVHQPRVQGERDRVARSARRSVLVPPAHEDFEPVEFARADIDLWLQRAQKAPIADGQAKILLEPRAFLRAKGEGGFVEARFALGAPLGLRQRRVRLGNQALHASASWRGNRLKPAEAEMRISTPSTIEGILESRQDALDLRPDRVRVGRVCDQQGKLVAAGPGGDVAAFELVGDALGGLRQQGVADGAAVELVDGVELIEADDRHREARLFVDGANGLRDGLFEESAIGQLGEVVEIGALEEFVLHAALVFDVGRRADAVGASFGAEFKALDQHGAALAHRLLAFGAVVARLMGALGRRRVGEYALAVAREHFDRDWQGRQRGAQHRRSEFGRARFVFVRIRHRHPPRSPA